MRGLGKRLRRCASGALLRLLGRLAPPRPGPQPDFAPRRVLVVRFGGLGDVVSATAVVERLRQDFPKAELWFLCGPAAVPLLQGQPSLDRVVAQPRPSWRGAWAALRRWRRLDLDRRDLLVLLEVDLLQILLAWAVPARYRLGLDAGGRGFGLSLTHPVALHPAGAGPDPELDGQSVAEIFQRPLFALTGKPWQPAAPRLALTAAERAQSFRDGDTRRVALLPTGTDPAKLWPAARYAALAERLAARGLEVLVLAGPDEAALAGTFAARAPSARLEIATRGLRDSLVLLAGCDLAVGNDTGPLHAAAALGVPTLALFGPTAWWAYGRRGPRHRVLIPAGAPDDFAAYDRAAPAITGIDLESVAAAALALLDGPERLGAADRPLRAGAGQTVLNAVRPPG